MWRAESTKRVIKDFSSTRRRTFKKFRGGSRGEPAVSLSSGCPINLNYSTISVSPYVSRIPCLFSQCMPLIGRDSRNF